MNQTMHKKEIERKTITIRCPNCDRIGTIQAQFAGKRIECPSCKVGFTADPSKDENKECVFCKANIDSLYRQIGEEIYCDQCFTAWHLQQQTSLLEKQTWLLKKTKFDIAAIFWMILISFIGALIAGFSQL